MKFGDAESIEKLLKIAVLGDEEDNYNYADTDVADLKGKIAPISEGDVPTKTPSGQPIAKHAKLEVLLKNITADAESGTTVVPVKCPGVGRVDDYPENDKGQPVCVHHGDNCPYFGDASFDLDTYYKQITCLVDKKEGV